MFEQRHMVPAPRGPRRRIFAPDMDVTGSLAVVTGATAGIGRATAFALGRAGARVAICARTEANVHATVRDLTAAGLDALGMACDVSDPPSVDEYASFVVDTGFREHRANRSRVLTADDVAHAIVASLTVSDRAMISEVDIRPTNP